MSVGGAGRPYWEWKDACTGGVEAHYRPFHDVVEELGIPRGETALDLGAGEGRWLAALAARFGAVCAVEPDDRIRARLTAVVDQDQTLSRTVSVRGGRAESLEFPPAMFDAVFCKNTFQYLDQPAALREIFRVLKPGGYLFVNSNAAGYYLMQIALGVRFRSAAKLRYGATCLTGTMLSELTGRRVVGQRYSSIARATRLLHAAGFRVVRAEPWIDHDLFAVRFMGCVTHFAVLGVKPNDAELRAGAVTAPYSSANLLGGEQRADGG